MSSFKKFREEQDPLLINSIDFRDKTVLVRVDFNCPIKDGVVTNNYRIVESLATLKLLKEKGAKKIILLTHLGRPKGEFALEFSIQPIRTELEKVWGEKVETLEYVVDPNEYARKVAASESQILLWENIRFWSGEKKNDPEFVKALVFGCDLFVNEAFSACHREHASVSGVTKRLPAYAGLRLGEETREIHRLLDQKLTPSVALVGGAKIETKVPVLEALGNHYDKILLGGKIALEYPVFVEGLPEKKSWTEKIELPFGYLGENNFDIDEKSANHFAEILRGAKKILWNGPMGKFEEPDFAKGSEIVAKAVSENQEASRLSGGGDTVALIDKLGLRDKAGFISTGGGAMLDYIAKGTLPGLENLEY